MEELALIIFTICAQAAIGTIVFVAIAKLLQRERVFKAAIATAAGLAVVGVSASFLHLGRPLAAVNALTHFATSWLSREIWSSAIFTGLVVLSALLLFIKPEAKKTVNILIFLAGMVGLIDVFTMASAYNYASVPAWNHGSIFVEFYAAAISMGAVLFLVLGQKEAASLGKAVTAALGIAMTLQVTAMVIYYIQLGVNSSLAAQQSLALYSGMSGIMSIKWLFILAATGLLMFRPVIAKANLFSRLEKNEVAATAESTLSTGFYLPAALLLITGQLVGRYIFYAAMVVSTVGLN